MMQFEHLNLVVNDIIDPNGIEVEFVEYSSDLPYQRNLSS